MLPTLLPETALPSEVFTGDLRTFRENFNRHAFSCFHTLANHPLFQIPQLLELAKSLAVNPEDRLLSAGDAKVGQRQDEVPEFGYINSASAEDILRRIETANARILIRRAEVHPEYRAIMETGLAQIEELIGVDLQKLIKRKHGLIFITSPNRVTPYHIDRECNFLLQIHGAKDIDLFDRSDREMLTEEEIEHFWTVDRNSARSKPEYEERARVFDLVPGTGVHIPVNAPHWVKNNNEVSVSFSVVFHFHEHLLSDIYRVNHYRRRGLHLAAPKSASLAIPDPQKDFLKQHDYKLFLKAAAVKKKLRAG